MDWKKWRIIEDFVLNDGRFDSEDFEEYLEVVENGEKDHKGYAGKT